MPGHGVRALARDVFFYDIRDRNTVLGGLVLNPGVTNADFYTMINIVFIMSDSSTFFLRNGDGDTIL
ncbi:hypothetical protein QBC46DRAFT_339755 [Diplogelasinospora grovesii]|uniref:DUF7881 domain-containing protein n=1 Tax=Diplogelasinospora grovesii TaxID=303347 RepID=A0AAN6S5X5_9PEZI|nr:hypothetical protein QBC46DRAFT_339755 [Diplogelasinospora grovesii]